MCVTTHKNKWVAHSFTVRALISFGTRKYGRFLCASVFRLNQLFKSGVQHSLHCSHKCRQSETTLPEHHVSALIPIHLTSDKFNIVVSNGEAYTLPHTRKRRNEARPTIVFNTHTWVFTFYFLLSSDRDQICAVTSININPPESQNEAQEAQPDTNSHVIEHTGANSKK